MRQALVGDSEPSGLLRQARGSNGLRQLRFNRPRQLRPSALQRGQTVLYSMLAERVTMEAEAKETGKALAKVMAQVQ